MIIEQLNRQLRIVHMPHFQHLLMENVLVKKFIITLNRNVGIGVGLQQKEKNLMIGSALKKALVMNRGHVISFLMQILILMFVLVVILYLVQLVQVHILHQLDINVVYQVSIIILNHQLPLVVQTTVLMEVFIIVNVINQDNLKEAR